MRTAIWRAAWASDHPDAFADRSLPDLPLTTIAKVFTAETIYRVAKDAAECFGAMGVMRDMPLQKYIHDAMICLHTGDGNADDKLRIAEALVGYRRDAADARRGIEERTMDFSLSNEQRNWQMTARKFAEEEIKPITLDLDEAPDAHGTFDWDIVEKGIEARLPHHGGAEGIRRRRHRLRDPGAGDGRTRPRRQRDLEDLQPELEVEPPDLGGLQRRAEGALPAAVRRRPPLPARQGHHRADRRLRQPPAAEGRAQGRA